MTRSSIRWKGALAWALLIAGVGAAVLYVYAAVLPLFTGVR